MNKLTKALVRLVWCVTLTYLLLITLTHLPPVQRWIGDRVATAVGQALGTTVEVGTVNVGFLDRIIIDNVTIYDQQQRKMILAARLAARIDYYELLRGDRIVVSSAQLFGFNGRFYKTNDSLPANYQFVLDSLASDNQEKSTLHLSVNSLIIRRGALRYDRTDKPTTAPFDLNHLSLSDISARIDLPYYTPDSLEVELRKLSLTEASGLRLNNLAFRLTANRSGASVTDFRLQLPNTDISLPSLTATYQSHADTIVTASLRYTATLGESKVTAADLAALLPQLQPITLPLYISAHLEGTANDAHLRQLSITADDHSLEIAAEAAASGFWPANGERFGEKAEWSADIRRLACHMPQLTAVAESAGIALPALLPRLGNILYTGSLSGTPAVNSFDGQLQTDCGNASVRLLLGGQRRGGVVTARLETDGIDLATLLANNSFGTLKAEIDIDATERNGTLSSLTANALIGRFDYNGYQYQNIALNGDIASLQALRTLAAHGTTSNTKSNTNAAANAAQSTPSTLANPLCDARGSVTFDDPNCCLTLSFSLTGPSAQLNAAVRHFNPSAMHLTDKHKNTDFSFDLTANIDTLTTLLADLRGVATLKHFTMTAPEKRYALDRLTVTAAPHSLSLQSDFGHVLIDGSIDPSTVAASCARIAHTALPSLVAATPTAKQSHAQSSTNKQSQSSSNKQSQSSSNKQSHTQSSNNNPSPSKATPLNSFTINAELTKADWLNDLLGIPLSLYEPVTLLGEIDDESGRFSLQCAASRFAYNGEKYRNLIVKAGNPTDTLMLTAQVRKMQDNGNRLNLKLQAAAAADWLRTSLAVNDNQRSGIQGLLDCETLFSGSDILVNVRPSTVSVKDTLWQVSPSTILYRQGDLYVNNFAMGHDNQYIKVNGLATRSLSDSITVDLQGIDVQYVLNLINFRPVRFMGSATGKAYVKSVFHDPEMYARLTVHDFKFEGGRMGTLAASVEWNKDEHQIDINAYATDSPTIGTSIQGFVSPSRNVIDLAIGAHNTNVEFIEAFCGSFMNNVKANAHGLLRLHGPLNSINLTGQLVVDGDIRIRPLNVTYSLRSDTIRFLPDNIVFRSDTVRDRNGNIGIVSGALHHKSLTRLTYDLAIDARHLLCYDTHDYGEDVFYGTAYGTGQCTIQGGGGSVDIDVNITPERGSFIEYNAASPDAIADQQFITWRSANDLALNASPPDDSTDADAADLTDAAQRQAPALWRDLPSDIRINFIINVTPATTLRVLMDKATGDKIALRGTGSIKASYFNKGAFEMFGTYLVDDGTYTLTIQNIMKREFSFLPGGSIVFIGDPYAAALSLQAMHTVNSVPLSDLQIGKSFSSNNVRVDCLMNITGTPYAPRVDFDLDMPTVSSDAEQMVRTIVNSEEEMNQQVVYLLSVGRFYLQRNGNNTDDTQSQASLAMQSFLSGTVSQQINTLIGGIVKNPNWTFGANISTGNEGFYNAEYEGLLSGRMWNNRLVFNGQFGYRDNPNATSSFIGDFDLNYLLTPNGNFALKVYNQSNDRYFIKSSLNTQGIGLILKRDF